jgi:O-antigen/teichoic acid export membrane protein
MNVLTTIKKHSGKYLAGSLFSAVVTLLMMKYYTSVFSPSEFGVLALYLIVFEYVRALVSLNMDYGITRLYFDYKEKRRDEYLSTMFWFIMGVALFVIMLGIFLMDYISILIAPDSEEIFFITLFAGVLAVFVNFFTRILINEHHSVSVMKHNIFQTIVNHLSSYILISLFHLGIFGRMSGQGFAYLVNTISLVKEFSREKLFNLRWQFNQKMAKETFLLSLPLMFLYFQNILFLYLDRIFLKHFMGDSAVGVYTLGYMLGQGLSLVYEAISQAILPKFYKEMEHDYEKSREELEIFSYKYYIVLSLVTLIISFLSPTLVNMVSQNAYAQAGTVMPFVMAGFMMGGFYKIPSLVLGFHKVVWFYPFLAIISFGANALLNWWLIPIYGIVGAALASFIGIFIYSVGMQYMVLKYMTIRYRLRVFLLYMVLFIIVMGVFYG